VVSSVSLDWESDPFASLAGNFTFSSIDLGSGSFSFANGAASLSAAVELERVDAIDTTNAEAIVGAETGDVFTVTDADNLMVGSLGSDRYEARIQEGATNGSWGTQTINDMGRSRGGSEEDAILVEGARDLGDLTFSRETLAAEGAGRSLGVDFGQHREDGTPFATGTINVFNQFSLSQANVYKVEKIQIGEEFSDPFEALVQTYYFGDVTGTTASGDVIEAQADRDSILIGKAGNDGDEFHVAGPTSASAEQEVVASGDTFVIQRDEQDVWIYGMDGNEEVVIDGPSTNWVVPAQAEEVTLEGGDKVLKVQLTNSGTASDTSDDLVLNLFFADAGNVDSTSVINKIQWES